MKRDYLWLNFVVSVWLLILYSAVFFVVHLSSAPELNQQFGPFAARVALWPLAVGAVELLLWFRPYRYREAGCRIMSGFMGIVLILFALLVPLLVSDMYQGISFSSTKFVFYLYISVSHLVFATFGTEYQ